MAIITLSRKTFSGTRELAGHVAETLGYRLVSRDDIIEKTAQYGMSGDRQDRARRRRLGMLQRVDLGWVHYLVFTRAALTKEIRQGSLIYLGGNGPALFKDFPNVLNVAVVADMDYRIDRLLRRTDYVINRKKARRIIEDMDEKEARWRKALHVSYSREDGLDGLLEPGLVIEQGLVSPPEACELIRAMLEGPQYQTIYKSLETIDILTAAAELRARIAMNEDVVDDNVDVTVQDGMIVVSGSVRSTEDWESIKELLD